ncbi:hypothetical protein C8J56DRAFT_210860 [Mycena floridula]|nr:hypothetical protein C8J56DRAFT_210860 [Mycena floridula]
MLSRRHSAIAFLWLAATSSGKITVTLPDHITVEQQTVIRWTRGAQDPVSNYGVRTVPFIDLEVRALHPDDKSRLSGTITVVFHESPTGLLVLEVLNKENPNIVYTTSSPFNVFNTDGTTGSEGSPTTLSRTATSSES